MTASLAHYNGYLNQAQSDLEPSGKWFSEKLKLKNAESLNKYFNCKESDAKWKLIKDNLSVNIKRVVHWIPTGIWIDSNKVGRLINEYRYLHEQGKDNDLKIRELCQKILGEGFYERSLQEAMEETTVESISNRFSFFNEFIKSPVTVGAILPSSKFLSKEITKALKGPHNTTDIVGRRILEAGPGTGIFTREIIKNLKPQDQLDLIEFDEKFCNILRNRFGHLPNVRIHHVSILDFEPKEDKYDFVISGLPLNAFHHSKVEQVYDKFKQLIKEGGSLSYFEYIGLLKIKHMFVANTEKDNIRKVLDVKKKFFKENQGSAERVWLNAPPARVCRCILMPKN